MRRLAFIAGLAGAAAWPAMVARAQQSALPVIGFLFSGSLEATRADLPMFLRGLAETGYVEGRNVAIEYRWANDRTDRLPGLAADLVRRKAASQPRDHATSAAPIRRPTNRISDRRAYRAGAHLKRIRNNTKRCGIGYQLVEQLQLFCRPSITGPGGFGDGPQAILSGRAPEQFNSIGRCFRVVLL